MSIFSWFGRGKMAAKPPANEAALTAAAAKRGLSWDMTELSERTIVRLMHDGQDIAQVMRGEKDPIRRDMVMPPVEKFHFIEACPLDTPNRLKGEYETREEAMRVAEMWATTGGIEQRAQFERDNPDRLTDAQERQVRALNEPGVFFQKPEVDQLSEASESYHAGLAALAESRGADMDRGSGFDLGA